MAIYDVNGNELMVAYDIDGNTLTDVYDVDGTPILESHDLTVMTYNVMRWEGLNANQTIQDIAFGSDGADLIGIQEWGYTTSGGSVGGVNVLTYLPNKGYSNIEVGTAIYNKNAFVSKYALSNVSETVFPQHSSVGYQMCDFVFGGKTITWINTHLYHANDTWKAAEANEIYDVAEECDYVIITGDFNTGCKSVSDADYINIMKQFVDAGYNCANCSNQFGFLDTYTDGTSLEATWYPCDIIITSSNIDMVSVRRDMTKVEMATGSVIDHVPLIAYLNIN